MEQAWKRQPDGTFEPIALDWCEPCAVGVKPTEEWQVDLRIVGPNFPGHPNDTGTE